MDLGVLWEEFQNQIRKSSGPVYSITYSVRSSWSVNIFGLSSGFVVGLHLVPKNCLFCGRHYVYIDVITVVRGNPAAR